MANPEVPCVVEQKTEEPEPPPPPAAPPHNAAPRNLDWPVMVAGLCFQSAVAIALQSSSSSSRGGSDHKVLITFDMSCLAMVVAVAALCVSIYISNKYPFRARALEHVGVLSGLTAFLLTVTMSFPLYLKLTSWAIFALALVTILVYN